MIRVNDLRERAMAMLCSLNQAAASSRTRVESRSLGGRLRSCFRCGNQGQSIVEFALVLPILLMVLTAIFAFGMLFFNQLTLVSSVGVGGQYLQTIRQSTTNPCSDTFTAITQAAPSLDPTKISLSFVLNATNATTTKATTVVGNTCSGDQTMLVLQSPATVTATYPCSMPIFGYTWGTCQLSASTTEFEY